ncbi:MAG TPA: protein kinase [Nannocystaceae bacterium]|nr:protein kinase [Nannocystaceae bacterium]
MGEAHDTSSGPADLGADTLSDAVPLRRSQLVERGTAIGRYVVIESVGSGGMSTVYAAYDPELDRRVALKVMRATSDDSEKVRETERSRLLREAQAMARLSHPNVVTVHDVGTFGDRVFLAMHFVDGETLGSWARHAKPWREVVEMYGYAGRGLAAAHKVGLVHRDFKPDNVLVDHDRRVRVTDFGLARPVATALASESSSSAPVDILTSSSRLEKPITLAGSIMGTPAYMAPEQYLGQTVDARSDQFSFCVALWEALTGSRPFPGETLGEVAHSVTRGNIRTFPQSQVTARVRRALERGLRRRPEERFADMDELLRELAPPSRRRPLVLAGAAAGLVALGAFVSSFGSDAATGDPCSGAAAALDESWNDTRRANVSTALASGDELDPAARTRAVTAIDDYAQRWRSRATDACRMNKVIATQSDTAFEVRAQCLQRRRVELDNLLARIEHGGAVVDALGELDDMVEPEVCDDVARLLQTQPPPDDPAVRELIDELRKRSDDIARGLDLDELDGLRAQLDRLLVDVERVEWEPLHARVHWLDALLCERVGDLEGAERALHETALAAAKGHDSELLVRAWISLTHVIGQRQGRVAEGLQLARVAEVEIARSGYAYDTIRLLIAKGNVYQAANDNAHAREAWQRALDMVDGETVTRSNVRAVLLNNLGTLDLLDGDALAALARFREARDITVELFGTRAQMLADNDLNMCLAHHVRGAFEDARVECERALELLQRPDADKAALARVLQGLVGPTLGLGRLDEARALAERASKALRGSYGEDSYAAAAGEISLAQVAVYRGEPAVARSHAQAADDILRALGPAFEQQRTEAQTVLGIVAFGEGDLETARSRCSEAIALSERGVGPMHPQLVEPLTCAGAALAGLGRHAEARPLIERALAIGTRWGGDPLALAHARQALAEIVLAEGSRDRARDLIRAARRGLDPVNPRVERYAKELDAWLEAHR